LPALARAKAQSRMASCRSREARGIGTATTRRIRNCGRQRASGRRRI